MCLVFTSAFEEQPEAWPGPEEDRRYLVAFPTAERHKAELLRKAEHRRTVEHHHMVGHPHKVGHIAVDQLIAVQSREVASEGTHTEADLAGHRSTAV